MVGCGCGVDEVGLQVHSRAGKGMGPRGHRGHHRGHRGYLSTRDTVGPGQMPPLIHSSN